MKRNLFLYLFIFCVQIVCAETVYSLRKYFQDNILKLDPMEGVYDVDLKMRYLTPYVDDTSKDAFTWYVKKEGSSFVIYSADENGRILRGNKATFAKIGETNAYYYNDTRFNIHERFVLNNEIQFRFTSQLSHNAAKELVKNPNLSPSVHIYVSYNGIKSYPTSSMYIEAAKEDARKAEQEYQKALEEAQKRAGWSGSGFALNQGHIVTNYHVIEDAKTILIKGVKGDFQTELRAKVVATDKINDLAILKIDDERFKGFGAIPYKVKREMSDVGESVWALGYPMTDVMGEEVKFTDGKISSRTGIQGDMSVYQISVPIQPGNSGGALFDNYGNIVGITSSGLNREEFNSENVNYAIKTSYLYNLIESSLSSSILPQGTAMKDQPLTQKIKLAKNFVYIILCSSSPDFHSNNLPAQSKETINEGDNNQSSASQISINKVIRDTLVNGDIVVTNPIYRNNGNLTITKVTLTRLETIIEFKWHNTEYYEGWCNINRNACIRSRGGSTYKLKFAENISYSPDKDDVPYGSEKTFKLHFDKIPYYLNMFDFIESDSSPWKIYDIRIQ